MSTKKESLTINDIMYVRDYNNQWSFEEDFKNFRDRNIVYFDDKEW